MLSRIPWPILVLIGGLINVCVNYGYKVTAASSGVAWTAVGALTITALALAVYALAVQRQDASTFVKGKLPLAVIAMGIGVALNVVCFLSALKDGPISLVDPLWACIYALTSVLIGMLVIRERPSKTALFGIGLYLLGAVLMGIGQS